MSLFGRNRSYVSSKRATYFLLGALLLCTSDISFSQMKIAHLQPDALDPGMTIAMEVLAPAKDSGAFGNDGLYLPQAKIQFVNSLDSLSVIFGPVIVSWNGRVIQVPVMVKPDALARSILFRITNGNNISQVDSFEIR